MTTTTSLTLEDLADTPNLPLESITAFFDQDALTYISARDGELARIATYQGHDGRHTVCVHYHEDWQWRVIDVAADGTAVLIERMKEIEEPLAHVKQAARDWATEMRRFMEGDRDSHPGPHQPQMQMEHQPAWRP